MTLDMSPAAVTRRLREVGRLSRLAPECHVKVDMSPAAVTRRLRKVEEMRRLCLWLGKAGREARERGGAPAR